MKTLKNPQKMINVLIVTSILMVLSVFIPNTKVLGTTLTIWILNIGWVMWLLLGDSIKLSNLIDSHDRKINEAKDDKRHFEVGIRFIALPMVVIGVITIFMQILMLFIG